MGGGGGSDTYPPNPNHIIMYAPYVENYHNSWLGDTQANIIVAQWNNPFASAVAYDPDSDLDAMLAALNAYCNVLLNFHNSSLDISVVAAAFDAAIADGSFNPQTAWTGHLTAIAAAVDAQLLTTTEIDESVNQYSEQLQADIEEKVLPQFEAGMRDINAVMSSSFIIGSALIFAEKDRNVAKYAADLRLANWGDRNKAIINVSSSLNEEDIKMIGIRMQHAEIVGKFWIQGVEYKRLITDKIIDVLRMKIVAKKEEADENLRIQEARRKWIPSLSQYMAAMIGAAGGGHAVPEGSSGGAGSSATSVLGGVMAGASIGAMFAGEYGNWTTGAGAVAGGLAGALL